MVNFNRKLIIKKCIDATNAIQVGKTYFLSSFHDKEGAIVKVLSKSTKENSCGWPSEIEFIVIEADDSNGFYKIGKTGICNATNLYVKRYHASTKYKFGFNIKCKRK